MLNSKICSFVMSVAFYLKKYIKEFVFGFYLIIALSVSVIATMQGGSGYGTTMFFCLVLLSVALLVPKVSCFISNLNGCNFKTSYSKLKIFGLYSLLSFCLFLFWFAAYLPGGFSFDSIVQLKQALDGNYDDWHPVLHTLLLFTLPLKLTGSIASIVFVQIILFSIVLGALASTVYAFIGKKWTAICVLPIIISPWTLNIAMIPWKDVMFAMGAASCMVCAIYIYFRHDSWAFSIWKIALFSVLLAITTILRHNGILFTATLVLALCFYMPKKYWVLLVSIFIIVVGLVRGPLYSALDVKAPGHRVVETMGFPLTVVMHVAKFCPSCLDSETAGFVDSLTVSIPDWKNKYDLTGFNSIKHLDDGIDYKVIERAGRVKILKMMLNSFWNAPVQSAVAVGAMTSIVYGLEVNCDNDPGLMFNNFGVAYGGSKKLQSMVVFYTNVVRKTPIRFFISTIGMPLIVMIAFILFRSRFTSRSLKRALLCSPIFVYDLGTMFFMSGAESRFFYVNLLICPLVVTIMLREIVPDAPKKENGALSENSD